jgi:hypothetical protein
MWWHYSLYPAPDRPSPQFPDLVYNQKPTYQADGELYSRHLHLMQSKIKSIKNYTRKKKKIKK